MRDWKSGLPAMVFAAVLLTAAPLAVSGGRDVPDQIAEGSEEAYAPVVGDVCPGSAMTRVTVGWLSFDVITAADGTVSMQPSLVRAAGQILRRVLAPGEDRGDACTAD